MHELSITESILSIALEKANEIKSGKITKINVTLGELSGVVDECVKFYFDFLSKDTIAAEASLCFERPSVQLRCRSCGSVFSPENDWTCPDCRENKIEVVSGRECYVSSIEVE